MFLLEDRVSYITGYCFSHRFWLENCVWRFLLSGAGSLCCGHALPVELRGLGDYGGCDRLLAWFSDAGCILL